MDNLQHILRGASAADKQEQGPGEQLDPQQVSTLYQQVVQAAPPDLLAQAHEEALQGLSPEQQEQIVAQFRAAHNDPAQPFHDPSFDSGDDGASPTRISALAQSAQQQQPDLLQGILGKLASDPAMRGMLAGAAAAVLQQYLGGKGGQSNTGTAGSPSGDGAAATGGLGDILGQLTGGGAGHGAGGGGLTNILGQLTGGGAGSGGLGAILGQMMGGGAAAPGNQLLDPEASGEPTKPQS